MDFVDWRKVTDKSQLQQEMTETQPRRLRGKQYYDYIEEIIQDAQERGTFSNLEGMGKPLNLEDESHAGDKAMAYRLLKDSGFAPPEIELLKEIRSERERVEKKPAKLIEQGQALRRRRVPPFPGEKQAFNSAVEAAATEYEQRLRDLNRKILTLNLAVPPVLHQPLLHTERLVKQFRTSCPLFD